MMLPMLHTPHNYKSVQATSTAARHVHGGGGMQLTPGQMANGLHSQSTGAIKSKLGKKGK